MSSPKHYVSTPFGEIAYAQSGAGPRALFIHGVFMNGYLWRHVIERVSDVRSCLAVDLLAHGATRTRADQDLSFAGQARMLASFCDRLELERVDLVANDSGAAIAQIFAAQNPERIRTLTLTNGDVHDNWPPAAFNAVLEQIRSGKLAQLLRAMLADHAFAQASFAVGYERPEALTPAAVREYIAPLCATEERVAQLERWFAMAEDNQQTVRIEPALRALQAPTQIVWGTADPYFSLEWAYWLKQTIPGARRVIELEGAKLFHPEERPEALAAALRELWTDPAVVIS